MNMMSLLKTAILSEGVKRKKMGALLLKNALRGMKDEMDYSKTWGAVFIWLKSASH